MYGFVLFNYYPILKRKSNKGDKICYYRNKLDCAEFLIIATEIVGF